MRDFFLTQARAARTTIFRHRLTPALLAIVFAGAAAGHSAAAADRPNENAVTHWNVIATNAFTPSQGTNPMAQSRTLAILHAAIHDALNAIEPRFQAYSPGLGRANGASAEAAVAAAAREVLVTLLPEQAALVESEYARALAAIPDGPAKSAGVVLGQASARVNITRRQADGADKAAQPYVPRTGPGEYQFTPPFDFAAQPGWGQVTPFVIDIREHTVAGPLDRSSSKYARDLAQVQAIGDINSAIRTREQSEIAQFWYEDSPLGWNRIANTAVRQRKLDLWSTARALALVNLAMADGFIAGFEAKYRFRFWRPETAIRAAGQSEHGAADADTIWRPFLITPPVPDYPSTHTVLGWAAAEVLIELFGDRMEFAADSLTLPGVIRHYKGFSAAAEENGQSRLYAGIHFPHAIRDGRRQGRSIGRAVAQALGPVRRTLSE